MAKKRKTRKQLLKAPDEFISFSSKVLEFAIKNKIKIFYALGVIVLFVIIGSGFRYLSNKAEDKAFTLLEQAVNQYAFAAKADGIEKAYQNVGQDFNFIIKKYSKSDGGKLANIIYANICYKAGDYQKAIDLYNKSLKDFNKHAAIKTLILSGIAYNYEAKNDYKTAADYFEMIIAQSGNIMQDEALFHLGRIYELMGETEKSTAAFKKIVSDHTGSIYIELARERVSI